MPSDALWSIQDWESSFFGVRTARVAAPRLGGPDELGTILSECRADGVQVLHLLADADHDESVRLAEVAGFHLVDVRVTLGWRAEGGVVADRNDVVVLRAHRPADVPVLEAIAETSYLDTRYFHDHRYPRAQCAALYATWIARSCQGMAEHVVVAEREAEAVGYVTCHLPGDAAQGRIGLVGVAAAARGLGVGLGLVNEAQRWFHERGAARVTVVTQGRNVAAQRLYQRAGFTTATTQLWYHLWLDR